MFTRLVLTTLGVALIALSTEASAKRRITDTTAPSVSTFTLPNSASSLTVTGVTLYATDNVGVRAYLVSENSNTPALSASGWVTSAPTSFTFSSSGLKVAYAWARDAAGNISPRASASVTITLPSPTPSPSPSPSASPIPPSGSGTVNLPGLPTVTLSGGTQPVAVPFTTWAGAQVAVAPSTTGKTYYVDAKNGNNLFLGTTPDTALRTIGAAVSKLVAGDTLLIKSGLYREVVDLSGVSGVSGKPITLGAYGDGEVIVDGSTAVAGWTNVSGSIWKASVSNGSNVNAVVVNNQVLKKYKTTKAIPASGSGQWYFDGSSTLYADMGSVNPTLSTSDILVVRNLHGNSTIFLGSSSYLNLIGLTVRGSGWAGIWSYPVSTGVGGQYVNVAFCDIKFNDGAGLVYTGGSHNSALYNRVYHNVLNNFPFGANGYASAGGGWPGSLGWSGEAYPIARGNVVALNGGEGIISYGKGTANGLPSGNTLFEQNVSYDNFSMNSYVDNQPNHVIRNNLFYRHSPDPSLMWDPLDTYTLEKFRTCLALADEYASGSPAGTASMANAQVYNNLLVGCRYGISDYNESTTGHGMKNHLIVNNTIILDSWKYTTENIAGITIGDNGSSNTNTVIANNIIYRPMTCASAGDCPLIAAMGAAKFSGITLSNNIYFASGVTGSSTSLFTYNAANSATPLTFSGWQSLEGQDLNSLYQDPLLVDANTIEATATGAVDYLKAGLGASSPAKGFANPMTSVFTFDFTGASRGTSWSAGALQ